MPSITITLPLDPSGSDLRKARELLAFLRSLSQDPSARSASTADVDDDDGEDAPAVAGFAPPVASVNAHASAALHEALAVSASPVVMPPAADNGAVMGAVDSTGLPWDARIHASNRSTNADGSWRRKRNLDDATYAAVVAELRGAKTVSPPAPMVAATLAPPPPPPVPVAPPAPPPPAASGKSKFVVFMESYVQPGLVAGKFKREQLNEAAVAVGLQNLVGLSIRPDLVPAATTYLDAIVGGQDAATAAVLAQSMIG